jgi:hypothetical protein
LNHPLTLNGVFPANYPAAAHARQERRPYPGGHFDAYVKGFDASSGPALNWFREHLAP